MLRLISRSDDKWKQVPYKNVIFLCLCVKLSVKQNVWCYMHILNTKKTKKNLALCKFFHSIPFHTIKKITTWIKDSGINSCETGVFWSTDAFAHTVPQRANTPLPQTFTNAQLLHKCNAQILLSCARALVLGGPSFAEPWPQTAQCEWRAKAKRKFKVKINYSFIQRKVPQWHDTNTLVAICLSKLFLSPSETLR